MSDGRGTPGTSRQAEILARLGRGLDRGLEHLEAFVVAGSVLGMAGIMIGHVLGRTLLDRGIPGTFEVTEILIVLITFAGISYAARRARHISMSALYDQLHGTPRKLLLITIHTVTAALMFYMAWLALDYILGGGGDTSTSALQIPKWTYYSLIPIGFFLAGLQYTLTVLRNLTSDTLYRSFTEVEEYDAVPDQTNAGQNGPDH